MTLKPSPFEILSPGQYFIRRKGPEKPEFEDDYWGPRMDPDGHLRNLLDERNRKVNDLSQELDFINARKPGRILDIGCGPGFLLSGVKKGWECFGVELSRFAAERACKWGNIFIGSLEKASYPEKSFDVITAYQVIEHLPDPVPMIMEIRRILKDDGALVLGVPNFDSACARRYGDKYRMLNDKTHVALYSPNSIRRLLRDFGFVVENIEYPYFEMEHFTEQNLLRLLDSEGVSPPFYGNLMTVYARKMTPVEARQIIDHITAKLGPLADGDC